MSAIDLIKAKQKLDKAQKEVTEAREKYEKEQREKRFAPLRAVLDEVAGMPSLSYRYHATRRNPIPMGEHWGGRSTAISVTFYEGGGNFGLMISSTLDSDPERAFEVRPNGYESYTQFASLEKAQDILVSHIARYLITDDENPES